MTSTWSQSQPPASTSWISAASLPKSADRIEGAMIAMARLYPSRRGGQCGMRTALLVVLFASPSFAATITVNTTAGIAVDGRCSLVEAVFAANNNNNAGGDCTAGSGADTIVFDASLAGADIDLVDTTINVSQSLTIDGAAALGVNIGLFGGSGVRASQGLTLK